MKIVIFFLFLFISWIVVLEKNKKIMYTPVNPNFAIYVKVGCEGIYITRTCKDDGILVDWSGAFSSSFASPRFYG